MLQRQSLSISHWHINAQPHSDQWLVQKNSHTHTSLGTMLCVVEYDQSGSAVLPVWPFPSSSLPQHPRLTVSETEGALRL